MVEYGRFFRFDRSATGGGGLSIKIEGCAVSDVVAFSTKSYWEAPSIRDIIRRYLVDRNISPEGIEWILADIAPRLAAISADISVDVPTPALEVTNLFVSCLHKMTSKMLMEVLKLEIELYRARQ